MLPEETVADGNPNWPWIRSSAKQLPQEFSVIREGDIGASVRELIGVYTPFHEHIRRVMQSVSARQAEPRIVIGDVRVRRVETVHRPECDRPGEHARLPHKAAAAKELGVGSSARQVNIGQAILVRKAAQDLAALVNVDTV